MKINEIFDNADSYALMTKLLKKQGFDVDQDGNDDTGSKLSTNPLQVYAVPSRRGKYGNVMLVNDWWWFDACRDNGTLIIRGDSPDEQDVLDFFKRELGKPTTQVKESILNDEDLYAFMTKLLEKNGFFASPYLFQCKYAILISMQGYYGIVQLVDGVWKTWIRSVSASKFKPAMVGKEEDVISYLSYFTAWRDSHQARQFEVATKSMSGQAMSENWVNAEYADEVDFEMDLYRRFLQKEFPTAYIQVGAGLEGGWRVMAPHRCSTPCADEQEVLAFLETVHGLEKNLNELKEDVLDTTARLKMLHKILERIGCVSVINKGQLKYIFFKLDEKAITWGCIKPESNDRWTLIFPSPSGEPSRNIYDNEEELIDEIKRLIASSINESLSDDIPLIWHLVDKLRGKRLNVEIDARVVWAKLDGSTIKLQRIKGYITKINPKTNNVGIYSDNSQYEIRMQPDDDERLTLIKDPMNDNYWIRNYEDN